MNQQHNHILTMPLFALGVGALAFWHARRWRADQALAVPQVAPPATTPAREPLVSVLVAAWNEAALIEEHIEAFLRLRYPNKQLIICAGGSDNTYRLALAYNDVQIVVLEQQPGEGKQAALRRCLAHAEGNLIFLTDADCLLDDQAFEATLAPLLAGTHSAATGRYQPLAQQQSHPFVQMQWCSDNYARANNPAHQQGEVEGLIGRNAALTRELLARTGDFAATVAIGTDYYLARQIMALGERVAYVHGSSVATSFATAPAHYVRQQSRWLRNILQHGPAFAATAQVRATQQQCLIGLGIAGGMVALPFVGAIGRTLWLLAFLHGLCSRWRYVQFAIRTLKLHPSAGLYLKMPFYLLLDLFVLAYSLPAAYVPGAKWRW
jgi:cellulose synthase/poly-beta-1,6-N-acetylglucosamine synthase-like glycosyltransferase